MKKKLPAILFIALFTALCLLPFAGRLVFGASSAGANERRAAMPQIKERDGSLNTDYLFELSEHFNSSFFLRQELITANSALTAGAFGVSAKDSVILGKNGWLYYADTLPDYTGSERMTEREVFSAAKNLALMQEYCEGEGASFLFVTAPNKNSLYPQNMPSVGAVSPEHDAERLLRRAEEAGVNTADLFKLFGGEEEILYFAHDSHWNSKGAALAADAVNAAFGKSSGYFEGDFSSFENHDGDLFEMLFPAAKDSETNPVYGGGLEYELEGTNVRPDSISISGKGGGEGSLLAFRDSFGNLLYPYLAASFGDFRFSRQTEYDLSLVSELGASCVMVELVERNLNYLIENVPLMPAPARDIDPALEPDGSARILSREQGRLEGYDLVQGEFLRAGGGECVYILCKGKAYEAFLLKDGGFAAYVPAGVEIDGALAF